MPRNHDRNATPTHLRRAPKGSTTARLPSGFHTVESFAHFAALRAHLGTGDAETLRQALARAAAVEPLSQGVLDSGRKDAGVWHLPTCPAPFSIGAKKCTDRCTAVRTALEDLGYL